MSTELQSHAAATKDSDQIIREAFEELLAEYLATNNRKRTEIITQAFNFAKQAHRGVKRASGEPYILHPIAVARIACVEIGLGSTSICAALLHDVVEDTDYTVEDISNIFGPKIAQLVDGLTKISGGIFGSQASSKQAENIRKLLLTMNDDIRVILIKMADRLHNMRTLSSLPARKQYKIAGETLYLYAPLAHRLGLNMVKTELENLSFRYEHPNTYKEISDKLEAGTASREDSFEKFTAPIRKALDGLPIQYEIRNRLKSVYSIWNKMETKHIPFEEIYDLMAARIVFDPEEGQNDRNMCFDIYLLLKNIYRSHPDRFRDWVSSPKANGYQSLHLTLMSNEGEWIEVQVRSRRMDEIAEQGFAAHWKYKQSDEEQSGIVEVEPDTVGDEESELDKWLLTIKEILDDPQPDALDFLDTIKLNLYASEIHVFTPKGEIKTMPQNATALDFAFSIHSHVGTHCIGAKVNHKLVPLSYRLQSGDQIEVLVSRAPRVQAAWIDHVTTARAKSKILSYLHKERKSAEKRGEEKLTELLQNAHIEVNVKTFDRICSLYEKRTKEDLFLAIGIGTLTFGEEDLNILKVRNSNNKWKKFIPTFGFGTNSKPIPTEPQEPNKPIDPSKELDLTEQTLKSEVKMAPCCNPIPGDDVLGYIDAKNQIVIHKRQCPQAAKLKTGHGHRIIAAHWNTHKELTFPVNLDLRGVNERTILCHITQIISVDLHLEITRLDMKTTDGIFEITLQIHVHDVEEVKQLFAVLRKIKALKEIKRTKD